MIVWHQIAPKPEELNALVTAGESVVMDVVGVGQSGQLLWHPGLIIALAKGGGILLVVEEEEDVSDLFNHPDFLPWGFTATLRMKGPSSLQVTRVWGRGVRLRDKSTVEVACLEGTPLLGLELEVDMTKETTQLDPQQLTLYLSYINQAGHTVADFGQNFPEQPPSKKANQHSYIDDINIILDHLETLYEPSIKS